MTETDVTLEELELWREICNRVQTGNAKRGDESILAKQACPRLLADNAAKTREIERLDMLRDMDQAEIARRLAAQGDGWQPISEAPKDGTSILVYLESDTQNIVFWEEDGSATHPWHTIDGPSYHRDFPKWWRPLPAPPSPSTEEKTR